MVVGLILDGPEKNAHGSYIEAGPPGYSWRQISTADWTRGHDWWAPKENWFQIGSKGTKGWPNRLNKIDLTGKYQWSTGTTGRYPRKTFRNTLWWFIQIQGNVESIIMMMIKEWNIWTETPLLAHIYTNKDDIMASKRSKYFIVWRGAWIFVLLELIWANKDLAGVNGPHLQTVIQEKNKTMIECRESSWILIHGWMCDKISRLVK